MDRSQKTRIEHSRAESLLYPLAAFLLAGGLNRTAAQKRFAVALAKAEKIVPRRIDHIGHPSRYADIVARWTHDRRFMSSSGTARPLLLNGKNEFRALIECVDASLKPEQVLGVFKRYGNVRRTKTNRYALVSPFFSTTSRNSMAFEPLAYFLSDASSTLGRILKRSPIFRGPEVFWRKVETTGLSERAAIEFAQFAAARSLEFLEELDDWLEARRARSGKKGRNHLRRVGIGLFSVYSDPETPRNVGGNSL